MFILKPKYGVCELMRKDWVKGTPVLPGERTVPARATVDYSLIELFPSPTMLNRAVTKNLEILWCVRARISSICCSNGHALVKMERESTEEVAHIFGKQLIGFLDKHSKGGDFQLVVKTRIPLADPQAFFHEIRHIEY